MNLVELDRALRQLRLSGMAAVLETRLRQAQTEKVTPIDLVAMLVYDELLRRQDRLLERRHKLARFRDPDRGLDTFDFDFNKKMNRALIHELATGRFITQRDVKPFDVFAKGSETGDWLSALDDFRNWLIREAAWTRAFSTGPHHIQRCRRRRSAPSG
jgi:DNA replication protein DnaC